MGDRAYCSTLIGLAAVIAVGMTVPADTVLLQYTLTGYTTASFKIDS